MSAEEVWINAYTASFGAHFVPAMLMLIGALILAILIREGWKYLMLAYEMPIWHYVTLEGLSITVFVLAAAMPIAWLLSWCATDASTALYVMIFFVG